MRKYRILIANRGEIAIRIARSVRELGWIPLGIYTSIDKHSLHRRFMECDYQVSNYLDMDEVIEAAEELGADAIHPGYGFLSENPLFARKVVSRNLVFIGPPPSVMELSGDKASAKRVAEEIGVPTLPWRPVRRPDDVIEFARDHGYPVLLKAVGGGGGMGMRVVHREEDVEKLFEQASKEAEEAFKDKRLYVEKYLVSPKHIEVQILGDGEKVIHLFERDCSIQRRHQKVIEEAPAPILGPDQRRAITSDAVKLTEHIGYVNAGTVEFLYDPGTGRHYFMEINARLQVEHPVTEMVTGIDIVKQQLLIALEGSMEINQDNVRIHGHAIEARINAENPVTMLPSPGTISDYREPSGPGIRVDSGVSVGSTIPSEYNPLIAKLIAWAPSRSEAINRMLRALSEYVIMGVDTNILLVKSILEHPVFIEGYHTTKFLDQYINDIRDKILGYERIQAIALSILMTRSVNGFGSLVPRTQARIEPQSHRLQILKRRAWAYWRVIRSYVHTRKRRSRK